MGLNNEAYIVNTGTSGEVIVPIKESVPYLNIKFLGWQFYNYHEVMSQNIANLADDILALKDGGGANLAFNLEEVLAATQQEIDTKLLDIDNQVILQVATLIEEALYNNNQRIASLETTITGNSTTDGLITIVANLISVIGDSSSGVIKDINTLKLIVGTSGEGLVGKVDTCTNNIINILNDIGNSTFGLIKQANTSTDLGNELNTSLTELENIIGDVNSGLIKQIELNTTNIDKLIPIVGNSSVGLVKDVQDLQNIITNIELNTDFASLAIIVGDDNTGLVLKSNLASTEIGNIKTIIGDENNGLLGEIKILNSYDLAAATGLINIVGDATTGLVKEINDLKTITLSSVPASALDLQLLSDSLDITNANLVITNTQLNSEITDLNILEAKVQSIDEQVNLPITGVLDLITNMPDTIADELLTYINGSTTKVFDQSTLYSMFLNSKDLTDKNIIDQFRTYFYDGGAYISSVAIGKDAVDAWVSDISSIGYTYLTNELIKAQIATNPTLDQIITNKDNIAILNGNNTVQGSVANQIQKLNDILLDTNPANLGVVTIINSDETTIGSTENKIKLNNDYLLSDNGPVGSSIIEIDKLQLDMINVNTKLEQTTEELQIEMVRYSTILPFLQQMFKLVNKVDNVTDSEIDLIFSTINDKLSALTISTVDYKLSYDTTTKLFTTNITLDKDYKFIQFDPLYPKHLSLYDASENYTDVLLDNSQLTLGIVNLVLPSILMDAIGTEVILTDEQALLCKLQFKIINSFGTEQLITVPVS